MVKSLRALSIAAALTAGVLAAPVALLAQQATPAEAEPGDAQPPAVDAPPAAPTPTVSEAQLARIQRALNEPSGARFDEQQLRFYLEIVAKQPSFAEFSKGYDFLNGPTKGGNPMSHQEFLDMVTPKEMYSSAGITATDQLQFALTNWLGQSLIRKALEELKAARTEREARLIRERIDRELEALTQSGRSR